MRFKAPSRALDVSVIINNSTKKGKILQKSMKILCPFYVRQRQAMVSSPEAARWTQGPLLGALALGGFGGFQLLIEVLEVLGVVQRGFFMLCLLRAPITTCPPRSRQDVQPGLLRNQIQQLPGEIRQHRPPLPLHLQGTAGRCPGLGRGHPARPLSPIPILCPRSCRTWASSPWRG